MVFLVRSASTIKCPGLLVEITSCVNQASSEVVAGSVPVSTSGAEVFNLSGPLKEMLGQFQD